MCDAPLAALMAEGRKCDSGGGNVVAMAVPDLSND